MSYTVYTIIDAPGQFFRWTEKSWTPTDLLPGANTLEVDATNLWVNRLIGDEQYPDDCEWTEKALTRWPDWLVKGTPRPSADRVTFTTWKHWTDDDPLLPSGLLGPVTLRTARLVKGD